MSIKQDNFIPKNSVDNEAVTDHIRMQLGHPLNLNWNKCGFAMLKLD
jgi:hypothetical protein